MDLSPTLRDLLEREIRDKALSLRLARITSFSGGFYSSRDMGTFQWP